MSGMVDFAYTLLLGWMRLLFDWLWKVFSGGGASTSFQWFLSHWKVWFVIMIVAGFAADWLMWIVRWRPYRVFLSRLRGRAAPPEEAAPTWDDDSGYYEPEMPMLEEGQDTWADVSPLSEINPDWASSLAMGDEDAYTLPQDVVGAYDAYGDESDYYTEAYEEPPIVPQQATQGYWEETPEEAYDGEGPHVEPGGDTAVYRPPADSEYAEAEPEAPVHYGRPVAWPNALYFQAQQDDAPPELEPEPEPEPPETPDVPPAPVYDEAPPAQQPPRFAYLDDMRGETSRRRRSLRGSAEEIRQYEAQVAPRQEKVPPAAVDTRKSRLVHPPEPEIRLDGELRTVTGKPVKRRGFFSDADEEPIAGLPPLQREDPFISNAEPYNPDFDDDDDEQGHF